MTRSDFLKILEPSEEKEEKPEKQPEETIIQKPEEDVNEEKKDEISKPESVESVTEIEEQPYPSPIPEVTIELIEDTSKIEKYKPIIEDMVIKKSDLKQVDEVTLEDKLISKKQPDWKLAAEAAKTVHVELSEDELDRLSMSLSEQTKEDLMNTIRSLNITDVRIELDSRAIKIMTNIVNKCKELNVDWFIAIVGGEGVGKSTLALNLFALVCKMNNVNPIEILLRTLIYDEDELLRFISSVDPREKFLALDLDEGANVLFNRESMQTKRSYILKFFNVMRFLNAIVFIPTPNIKFLDKNVKAHRIKSIFYIPSRGTYWFYDKEQVDRMLANETSKKWYWVEPKAVGSFSVNKELESIVNLIKENYIRMFSEKVKTFLQSEEKKKYKASLI